MVDKVKSLQLKFAITGSTGFLGVHLIHHLLENKHEIVAIKRENSSFLNFNLLKDLYKANNRFYEKLKWVNCELFDIVQLGSIFEQVDCVIHAAGFISYSKGDRDNLLKVNAEYTANVVNCALQTRIKKLIYISSTGAVCKKENELAVEDTPWTNEDQHTFYGYTKYLGECEVYRGIEEGLNATILNPGIILGYGNWNSGSLKLYKNAYNSFPFYSTGITGFVGVKDIARIVLYTVEQNNMEGKRYILVAENMTFKDVAETMAKHFNKRKPYIQVKGFLFYFIYLLMWIKEALGIKSMLSKETTKSSISKIVYSNLKILSVIPFKFTPIRLQIEQDCISYKNKRPT